MKPIVYALIIDNHLIPNYNRNPRNKLHHFDLQLHFGLVSELQGKTDFGCMIECRATNLVRHWQA